MSESVVSDEDMADLTGAVQPATQIRILREHGIEPVVRRDGHPRVTWEAVTRAMLRTRPAEPDWSALRKAS